MAECQEVEDECKIPEVMEYEALFPLETRYDENINEEYRETIAIAEVRNTPPIVFPWKTKKAKKRGNKRQGGNNPSEQQPKQAKIESNSDEKVSEAKTVPKQKGAEDRKLMAQKMREKRLLQSQAKKKEQEDEKLRLAAAIANRKKQMTS
ncbi:uncharacterized protein LOC102810232 [Saccoglossus kowalevskii]|uniref:Stress response protein NST1-like n=1 Tax=Saccoglossus kowalevskii TaxID=10224 RepID=A0ABM0LZ57_SACKO|nr:PREDICTED: stress response protein NST1-like [Saccoglossus kowalevskii]